jgi:hypothetical protein
VGAIQWAKHTLEYLGGMRDQPPTGVPLGLGSPAWGLWWGALAILVYLFGGQTSKFIYIDF